MNDKFDLGQEIGGLKADVKHICDSVVSLHQKIDDCVVKGIQSNRADIGELKPRVKVAMWGLALVATAIVGSWIKGM